MRILTILSLTLIATFITACEKEAPKPTLSEKAATAAENAGEKLEDMGEVAGEKLNKAKEVAEWGEVSAVLFGDSTEFIFNNDQGLVRCKID